MAKQKPLGAIQAESKDRQCQECKGDVIFEKGELVCIKCGLIQE